MDAKEGKGACLVYYLPWGIDLVSSYFGTRDRSRCASLITVTFMFVDDLFWHSDFSDILRFFSNTVIFYAMV